jgi:hypothetical protein
LGSAAALARDALAGIRRYSAAAGPSGADKEAIERALSALASGIDCKFDCVGPWIERAHGDLNCRNVLFRSDSGGFKLIDFPNVGPNCLAVDFAKAEAELVLIMMDWGTGRDCEFSRLKDWGPLAHALGTSFDAGFTDVDPEARKILTAILAIRSVYATKAGANGDVKRAYQLYLLSKVLRYVSYSDLTVAKRFLALLWAEKLMSEEW